MLEQVWPYVFLFSICLSSLIVWRTQIKGHEINTIVVRSAIGRLLILSIVFFTLISLPLINQPRISNKVTLLVGAILGVFGITLIIFAVRELTKTKASDLRGLATPEKLITTGPYRLIRHPANIGFISIFVGWFLTWGAVYCLYFIAPILVIGLIIESFFEERVLEKAFGDEYRDYKKRVGMYFPKMRKG